MAKSGNQPKQNAALGWMIRLSALPVVLAMIFAMALLDEEDCINWSP